MSADAIQPLREFRLDDERWRYRKSRYRRIFWWVPWLLGVSLVFLPLGILFWGVLVLRWTFLLIFGFGFAISAEVLVARYNDPVGLEITSRGVWLRWQSGKLRELPFSPGSTFRLYDATALKSGSTFTLRVGSDEPPRGAYLLDYGNRFLSDQYELTREAFDAIRQELVARRATMIREGPELAGSSTTLTEYRLPRSRRGT